MTLSDELRKSVPALMYCPSIYLEEMNTTTTGPISGYLASGLNPDPFEYESYFCIYLFWYLFEVHSIDSNWTRPQDTETVNRSLE